MFLVFFTFFALFVFFRRIQNNKRMIKIINASPPRTPPIIAPTTLILLLLLVWSTRPFDVDVVVAGVFVWLPDVSCDSGSVELVDIDAVSDARDADAREADARDSDARDSEARDSDACEAEMEEDIEASMTNCGSSFISIIVVCAKHLNIDRGVFSVQR